jgi:predicted nucleic acid-binding protein
VIFLDSSVIYNALVETELTEYAREVFEQNVPKITSDTAVDELWFALAKKVIGAGSARNMKKKLRKSEALRQAYYDVLVKILAFLQKQAVMVVPDSRNWAKMAEVSSRYALLPHDTRLIVTALESGATGFATLDSDFKPVQEEINLLPGDYWKRKG